MAKEKPEVAVGGGAAKTLRRPFHFCDKKGTLRTAPVHASEGGVPVRVLPAPHLIETVRSLALEANRILPPPVLRALEDAADREVLPLPRSVLGDLTENARLAQEGSLPLCQDCGLAVVFLSWGQEVFLEGASLREAVDEGIRRAYREGYLRKSVVADPLFDRVNTGDNTPAVVHLELVPGDRVEVTVAPKGMGSENMSRLALLRPADGEEGVLRFLEETVRLAGPNPCPPVVLGVGLGGNFETVALAAKKALLRPLGRPHPDPRYASLEREALARINRLGIGPGGYGGATTALAVHLDPLPTHIAGMPVAVNLCCHALRHASATL